MGRVAPGTSTSSSASRTIGTRCGNLEGAIWKIVRETSTERMMLVRKEAHIALELNAEDMEAIKGNPAVVSVIEPEYRTFSIKMNTAKAAG